MTDRARALLKAQRINKEAQRVSEFRQAAEWLLRETSYEDWHLVDIVDEIAIEIAEEK